MATTKPQDIAERRRRKIADSELGLLQVVKLCGLPYQTVHSFVRCYRDIYLTSAAKLAAAFGLELGRARQRKRRKDL